MQKQCQPGDTFDMINNVNCKLINHCFKTNNVPAHFLLSSDEHKT